MTKDKKKKGLTLCVAALLCMTTMLAGTFAWSNLGQHAKNEVWGRVTNPGGRLHDDFNTDTGVKRVYVENFTELTDGQPIIVRLRLWEYMETGADAGNKTAGERTDVTVKTKAAGADINDYTTWDIFNANEDDSHYDMWNWTMGGSTLYIPTDNLETDPEETASFEADLRDKTNMGYTKKGETYDGSTVEETLDGEVLTMAQWKAKDYPTGNFWVCGDDGWIYWAELLTQKTATSAVLQKLSPKTDFKENWYYAIYVEAQMVTADEISAEAKNPTGEGEHSTGFYTKHVAGEDGSCTTCAGKECPSEDMQDLLEEIAGSDAAGGSSVSLWGSAEAVTENVAEVQSLTKQQEIQKIYEAILEEEAAESVQKEEVEVETPEDTGNTEADLPKEDEAQVTTDEADTPEESAKSTENLTEAEAETPESEEETTTGGIATFFNLFKFGVQ